MAATVEVRAPQDLAAFERFCLTLTTVQRKPLRLEPFQLTMCEPYFDGVTETVILIPKKNGKTTLLAALALFHLINTTDAACVMAASSRKQARLMFTQARGFVDRSPALQELLDVKPGYLEIRTRDKLDSGTIDVYASDAETVDGVIPTLALVDELHRHRSGDLYGVFRDGLGPRDGQMVTISTAGDDDDSALGRLRAQAYTLPLKRDGAYRFAASADGEFALHEWALEPDEDRENMAVVKTANPCSWHTVTKLKGRRSSPSMTPWQWARFACGVWLQGEDTVISPVEWAACGGDPGLPSEGSTPRIGMDIGWISDTTALVPHWLEGDVAHIGSPRILKAPEGRTLKKRQIIDAAIELRELYGINEIVMDPEAGGRVLSEDLEAEGFKVVGHSQKPAPMSVASDRWFSKIREKKVIHPSDPDLTRHHLNAHSRKTDDGRWRFVKETSQSKKVIDGCIAAAIVNSYAVEPAVSAVPMMGWA